MLYDKLHAWWLTESRLTTMQTYVIARRWASDLMMALAYSIQLKAHFILRSPLYK